MTTERVARRVPKGHDRGEGKDASVSNPEMPWPDLSDLVTVLAAGESPSGDLDVITAATCRLLSVDAAVLSNAHGAHALAQAA